MMLDPERWLYQWMCPELILLKTDEADERRRAIDLAKKAAQANPRFWLAAASIVGTLIAGIALIEWYQLGRWETLGVIVVIGVANYVVMSIVCVPTVRRTIRQELVRSGFRICTSCGYDLRGNPEDRCSECGARFERELLPADAAELGPP